MRSGGLDLAQPHYKLHSYPFAAHERTVRGVMAMIITRLTSASMLMAVTLSGCVTAPAGPSVAAMPGEGKNFDTFQSDDANCRQYAAQQTGIAPTDAANQSLFGS